MVIEIVPKEKIKALTRESIFFYLSLVLLILVLALFFFFSYSEKKGLETLEKLDEAIAKLKTEEERELSQKLLGAKKRIEAISTLLSSHKKSTNVFDLLEKVTHPKVFLYDFSLDTGEGSVSFQGKTESFKALGQQIIIFKEEEFIKEINLSQANMGKEGEIDFSVSLLLDPEILKYK